MTMSSFQLILLGGDTSTVPSGADHGHPTSARLQTHSSIFASSRRRQTRPGTGILLIGVSA